MKIVLFTEFGNLFDIEGTIYESLFCPKLVLPKSSVIIS